MVGRGDGQGRAEIMEEPLSEQPGPLLTLEFYTERELRDNIVTDWKYGSWMNGW